jgi:suppressor of G2 allele of SKP1
MTAESFLSTSKTLFEQEKFAEAKTLLESAKNDLSATPTVAAEIELWIRKCNTHLSSSGVSAPPAAPKAATTTSSSSSSSPVVGPPVVPNIVAAAPKAAPVGATAVPLPSGSPRFEWSQTADTVTLSFFIADRTQEDVSVDIENRNVTVSIKQASGKEYQHTVDTLFAAVKPKPSQIHCRPSRVEVVLSKGAPFAWSSLQSPLAPTILPPTEVVAEAPAPSAVTATPAAAAPTTTAATTTAAVPPPSSTGGAPPPRFEWFQSSGEVTLTFFVKDRKPEDVTVSLPEGGRSFTANIVLSNGSTYTHSVDLFAAVQCQSPPKVTVRSMKVEIVLTKEAPYQWATLAAPAGGTPPPPAAAAAAATTTAVPATAKDLKYPNSKGKDWSKWKVDQEEEKPEGEQALNALFKQIYSNGSDEQRMAMMKSFQESNGTVLSTNWADVGSKHVKPEAPRGMVEKKYDE